MDVRQLPLLPLYIKQGLSQLEQNEVLKKVHQLLNPESGDLVTSGKLTWQDGVSRLDSPIFSLSLETELVYYLEIKGEKVDGQKSGGAENNEDRTRVTAVEAGGTAAGAEESATGAEEGATGAESTEDVAQTDEAVGRAEVDSYFKSVADKMAWLLLDPRSLVRKKDHFRLKSALTGDGESLLDGEPRRDEVQDADAVMTGEEVSTSTPPPRAQILIMEVGPRLTFSSPFSTNAVGICRSAGIDRVKRLERSTKYAFSFIRKQQTIAKGKSEEEDLIATEKIVGQIEGLLMDRMTEMIYRNPLKEFICSAKAKREDWFTIPVLEKGRLALEEANLELGLAWDDWDVDFYTELFATKLKRDPTNVECFDLAQSNSEHSRHWFFKGDLAIDGVVRRENLFQLVASTLQTSNSNNVIAFKDNSSAIRGFTLPLLGPSSIELSGRLGSSDERSVPESTNQVSENLVRRELTVKKSERTDVVFTAETHNFPTGVAPFPGAATGTGGRLRDVQAVGRGGIPIAGTAGYAFGNLHIPGYPLPWENTHREDLYPHNLASPLEVVIGASDGASDYGNKFGEPLIIGFSRSFGQTISFQAADEEETEKKRKKEDEWSIFKGPTAISTRREWLKPIMFSGGIGSMSSRNVDKEAPQVGDRIVKIGGPVYRIGMGGGAASSIAVHGDNAFDLDFNAVQRGDPEMEQKMNRVIRSCAERDRNPLKTLHDQGAGGNGNVLKELIEAPSGSRGDEGAPEDGGVDNSGQNGGGGVIYASQFSLGDPTISAVEIWAAEYQESNAALVHPRDVKLLKEIGKREKCGVDVVGVISGDGNVVLKDFGIKMEEDDVDEERLNVGNSPLAKPLKTGASSPSPSSLAAGTATSTASSTPTSDPVDLNLDQVLGEMPKKRFDLENAKNEISVPLSLPPDASLKSALDRVLRLPAVASKRFLTNKVDRSVTGLVAQQQCVGPNHTPLADVAVVALSHFDVKGAATSIGEQPVKALVNPAAGARMAVAEAILSLSTVKVTSLKDVKCSANWMWPAKLPGEGVKLVSACEAMVELLKEIGVGIDGGKDSLSMAARVEGKTVKCPGALVISAYVTVDDITAKVTPDLKDVDGETTLIHVDLSKGRRRIGGSALAQCYNQLGDECPDLEDGKSLEHTFNTMQNLISSNLVLSAHDISDGGILVAILEMAFAAKPVSLNLSFSSSSNEDQPNDAKDELFHQLFAEEAGLILQVRSEDADRVISAFKSENEPTVIAERVGTVTPSSPSSLWISIDGLAVFEDWLLSLHQKWENTSFELEKLQTNPKCAEEESKGLLENEDLQSAYGYEWDREWNAESGAVRAMDQDIEKSQHPSPPRVAILREEGSNGDREMAAAFKMAGFRVFDVTMTDLTSGHVALNQFRGVAFVGGFSYADVFGSAKGWAATIMANPALKKQFLDFYDRHDTFSLGVCNGCQLMALLGWIGDLEDDESDKENSPPKLDLQDVKPLRFTRNVSGRFESRFSRVRINPSPSIMLKGMENWTLGCWVAHGEGRLQVVHEDPMYLDKLMAKSLTCVQFVIQSSTESEVTMENTNDSGQSGSEPNPKNQSTARVAETESYPENPSGTPRGVTGVVSPNGRHLALMPHPERGVKWWQWPWIGQDVDLKGDSPWLKMFVNAFDWCISIGEDV